MGRTVRECAALCACVAWIVTGAGCGRESDSTNRSPGDQAEQNRLFAASELAQAVEAGDGSILASGTLSVPGS